MVQCDRCHKKALIALGGWHNFYGADTGDSMEMNIGNTKIMLSGGGSFPKNLTYCPDCKMVMYDLILEYITKIKLVDSLQKTSNLSSEEIRMKMNELLLPCHQKIENAIAEGYDADLFNFCMIPYNLKYYEVLSMVPEFRFNKTQRMNPTPKPKPEYGKGENPEEAVSDYVKKGQIKRCISIGPSAVTPLCAALLKEKDNTKTCIQIIETLGKIGDSRAVETIELFLNNDDTHIRNAAYKALTKIKTKGERIY